MLVHLAAILFYQPDQGCGCKQQMLDLGCVVCAPVVLCRFGTQGIFCGQRALIDVVP